MKPIAFIDANVLVPYNLMSLLLTMADHGLMEVRWSEKVLEETRRALIDRIGVEPDLADRRIAAMSRAFPEALVDASGVTEENLDCHPKDRHVLAAAIAAAATHLVTANLKDFPAREMERLGIRLVHPEQFLLAIMAQDIEGIRDAVDEDAARRVNPPVSRQEFLASLTPFAPTFANALHQWGEANVAEMSDVPALVEVDDEDLPLPSDDEIDFADPWHVAILWFNALHDPDLRVALRTLTAAPDAFGDYEWAIELLAGLGLASLVHRAVDREDIAFARFLPVGGRSLQAFAPSWVERVVFMTLVRLDDGTWRVWGLGRAMVSANQVR